MIKKTALSIFPIALLAFQSCSSAALPVAKDDSDARQSRLVLFDRVSAYSELTKPVYQTPASGGASPGAKGEPGADDLARRDLDAVLYKACGGTPPAKPPAAEVFPLVAIFVDWAISEIATWLVDSIDKRLQDEIGKYTVTRAATGDGLDLYAALGALPLADKMKPGTGTTSACYRASLFAPVDPKDPKSTSTLVADFVGLVTYDSAQPEVLKLTPVRLYYQRLDTPSADGQVAVDVKLASDVISLGQTSGMLQKGAIDTSVVAEKINAKTASASTPIYKVYDQNKVKPVVIPLPAWNFEDRPNQLHHSRMNVTVTFTEVGNVDWFTKNLAALLHANKDDVAKDIATEIKKPVDAALTGTPAAGATTPK